MLVDDIKKRMVDAMKGGRVIERDVLRVALGEIQVAESRNVTVNDEEAAKIIRKILKSNAETLAVVADREDMRRKLEEENTVLEGLLPKRLGVEEIVAALAAVAAEVKGAKSDGQATGVAMKHLKSIGGSADGRDVGEAVKRLRG